MKERGEIKEVKKKGRKEERKLNHDNNSNEKTVFTGVINLPQKEACSGPVFEDATAGESAEEIVGMEVVEEVVKEVVTEVEPKASDIQTR